MMEKRFRGFRSRNGLHLSENNYITNADFRNRKGFTLVELIVVLVILAILAAIAVPVGLGFLDRAREKRVVSNAEASMTATQTILNDSYNGGLGCIPLSSRDKARDMAKSVAENPEEFEMGTKFKIWTVKTWTEDGEVRSTDKYAGYFTTQYALFENTDGKVAFYNGKEWNVFDSLDKITDSVYSNLSSEDAIVIWPATGSDKASNPHMGDDDELVWTDDSSSDADLTVFLQLKENASAPDKLLFCENGSPATPNWQQIKPYSSEESFEEWLEKWTDPQNIRVKNRCYTNEAIKWEYIDPDAPATDSTLDSNKIRVRSEDLLAIIRSLAETDETSITFTAVPDDKYVDVVVSVSAINSNNLTVTGSTVKGKLNLAKNRYEQEANYSNDFFGDIQNIKVEKNSDNLEKDNFAWDSFYRFVDEAYPNSGYNASVGNLSDKVSNLVDAKVQSFIGENPEIDTLDSITLDFKVAAEIKKTVVLKENVKDNQNHIWFGGNDRQDTSFPYEFIQNEAFNEITYRNGETREPICSITTTEDGGTVLSGLNEAALLGKAGIHYPEKSPWRIKSWTIFKCNANAEKDGDDPGVNPDRKTSYNNPMKAALERLFVTSDSFHELAIVDMSPANSRLDATTKDVGERSVIWDDFYYLVTGNKPTNNTATSDDTLVANMDVVSEIKFISSLDEYNGLQREREICLSIQTTEAIRQQDGTLVVANRDEEYPCFILAAFVKDKVIDGKQLYKICVATEDGSDMMAIRSLQSMFADFVTLSANEMIEHMDIYQVTSTRNMFKDNRKYNSDKINQWLKTQNSKDMCNMFKNCYELNQPMTVHIDNATQINSMFAGCRKLQNVTLCGTDKNTNCPLSNNWAAENVFASTKISEIKIQNLIFTEFAEAPNYGNKELNNRTFKDNLTNGLYKLMNSAVFAKDDNNNRTLTKVEFENVICPNLQTTRSLFDQAGSSTDLSHISSPLRYVDLSGLSVPNNTSTRKMFNYCTSLSNQKNDGDEEHCLKLGGIIPEGKQMNMTTMFCKCDITTTKIDGLDTSNAKYLDWMFEKCYRLTEGEVCIKNAVSISRLFLDCTGIEKVRLYGGENNIQNCLLDDSNSDNVCNIFAECPNLTTIEIENMHFTNLKSLGSFFANKNEQRGPVSDPRSTLVTAKFSNLSAANGKVTSMASLFLNAKLLETITMTNLVFKNVNDMSSMFKNCEKLNLTQETINNIAPLNTNGVNCTSMFEGCKALKGDTKEDGIDVIEFDITNVKNISSMFKTCESLNKVVFKGTGFDSSSALDTGDDGVFKKSTVKHIVLRDVYLKNLKNDDDPYGTVDSDTVLKKMFISAKESLETAELTNVQFSDKFPSMSNLFNGFKNLTSVKFDNVKALYLGRMKQMFRDCTNLQTVTFSKFDAPIAWCFGLMFYNCGNLSTVDFGKVGKPGELHTSTPGAATAVDSMFYNCTKLVEIKGIESFDTSSATNMTKMFYNCRALTELDLSGFDTSSTTNMEQMFYNCLSLTELDLSGFDTSSVNNFKDMFGTNATSSLTTIYASEAFVVNSTDIVMFGTGLTSLVGGAGTSYSNQHRKSDYAHIDGGTDNPGYFTNNAPTYTEMKAINSNAWKIDGKDTFSDVRAVVYFGRETDESKVPADQSKRRNVAMDGQPEIWVWEEKHDDGTYSIYWWTEDNIVVKVNSESTLMFMYWGSKPIVSSFTADFQGLDFSEVKNFEKFFGTKYNTEYSKITRIVDRSKGEDVDYVFDISGAINTNNMFDNCLNLKSASFKGNVKNSIKMRKMFYLCSALEVVDMTDLVFLNTIKGENSEGTGKMFEGCSKLETIYVNDSGDGLNKNKITGNNPDMFKGCVALKGGNGFAFDPNKVDKTYASINTTNQNGYLSVK